MTCVLGVDGCRAGWFAVELRDDGSWKVAIFESMADLWRGCHDAARILLDMPIGLPDAQTPQRQCDRDARKLLSPLRHTSVFPPPARAALRAESYADACAINAQHTGRRLTIQAWHLAPKIRQADDLLLAAERARAVIREAHPEIAFWAYNGQQAMKHNKKRSAGRSERLEVLRRFHPQAEAIVQASRTCYPRRNVATDDILDALALAIAARHPDLVSLPDTPQFDAKGLRMEIVYPSTLHSQPTGQDTARAHPVLPPR